MFNRKKYGVVRADNLRARHRGPLYSVLGETGEDLENGMIGVIGDPVESKDWEEKAYIERELRNLDPIKGNEDPIVLVYSDEIRYEEFSREDSSKEYFFIPAGIPAKAYKLLAGDIFSVSKLVTLDDSSTVGKPKNYVEPKAGERFLAETADKPEGAFVGKILRNDTIGTITRVGAAGQVGRPIELTVIEVLKNSY